jgi:hypothetical protein
MRGSRRKIPSKNHVRQRCAGEFNYGVKGLNPKYIHKGYKIPANHASSVACTPFFSLDVKFLNN